MKGASTGMAFTKIRSAAITYSTWVTAVRARQGKNAQKGNCGTEKEVLKINLIAKYIIPLDTRTKKNSMSIAGTGAKCPLCGKRAKQFIRQGHANTEYTAKAARFLHPKPDKPISEQIHIVYLIFTGTKRIIDDLNLYASLDDLLVKEGIIQDDNRSIIRCRDGSRVLYDKDNPRAEIYIYEYDGNW